MIRKTLCLLLAVAAVALAPATTKAVTVDLELALLVDISGSVDSSEYQLQRNGYANAFNNATIQSLIASLPNGMAVTYIEWSGASQQYQKIGWTHLTDATSAGAFATAVGALTRSTPYNLTAPGSAINYAVGSISGNSFDGGRAVIDVSGDGSQNDGFNTATARNNALAAGIDRINGLAIGDAGLQAWYAANIQGGANSFTIGVSSFADFDAAIARKISAEITNTGVPDGGATLALLAPALLGLVALRRKS